MNCPLCQQAMPPDARFCPACGGPTTPAQAMPVGPPEKKKTPWWVFLVAGAGCFVIGIPVLGVLAAIALPNFMNMRAKGQVAACASAMGGMKTAFEMHRNDAKVYPTSFQHLITPTLYIDLSKVTSNCEEVYLVSRFAGSIKNLAGGRDYLMVARPKGMLGKACWISAAESGVQYTAACRVRQTSSAPIELDPALIQALSGCPSKGWINMQTCLGQ